MVDETRHGKLERDERAGGGGKVERGNDPEGEARETDPNHPEPPLPKRDRSRTHVHVKGAKTKDKTSVKSNKKQNDSIRFKRHRRVVAGPSPRLPHDERPCWPFAAGSVTAPLTENNGSAPAVEVNPAGDNPNNFLKGKESYLPPRARP